MYPQFSIVIPTYKRSTNLKACLYALCKQSLPHEYFEVIVVNDGGEEKICETIKAFESKISVKYFRTEENKGPAAARNYAIKNSEGDIILFLDDDALPTNNWLEAINKAWEKFQDVDGIGGCVIADPVSNTICKISCDVFNWYLEENLCGEYSTFLATCNASYRKSALDKIKGFDEQFKCAAGEDRDINIKIIKTGGKLKLVKNILVYHGEKISLYGFAKKYFNYGRASYKIHKKYPETFFFPFRSYINFYISTLEKYKSFSEKVTAFILISISHISNFFGYLSASLAK